MYRNTAIGTSLWIIFVSVYEWQRFEREFALAGNENERRMKIKTKIKNYFSPFFPKGKKSKREKESFLKEKKRIKGKKRPKKNPYPFGSLLEFAG